MRPDQAVRGDRDDDDHIGHMAYAFIAEVLD